MVSVNRGEAECKEKEHYKAAQDSGSDVTWKRSNTNKEKKKKEKDLCNAAVRVSFQKCTLRIALWQGLKKVVRNLRNHSKVEKQSQMASKKHEGNFEKERGKKKKKKRQLCLVRQERRRRLLPLPEFVSEKTQRTKHRGEPPSTGLLYLLALHLFLGQLLNLRELLLQIKSTMSRRAGKLADVPSEGRSLTPARRCHSIKLWQCAVMRACWDDDTSAAPLTDWRLLIFSSDYKHSRLLLQHRPPDKSRCTSAPQALIVHFLQTQQSLWAIELGFA